MGLLQRAIPFTLKLNPFRLRNLAYLGESYIITRTIIGATRIAADTPALNPKPYSRREKQRNQLERIFIETFGTLGTYVSLHAVQDLTGSVIEKLRPKLAPKSLVDSVRRKLNEHELQKLEHTLDTVFNRKGDLASRANIMFEATFGSDARAGAATLSNFIKKLADPGLLSSKDGKLVGKIAEETAHYFKPVNHMAVLTTLVAVAASAYLSGSPIQWINDRMLRQRLGPWLLDRFSGPESEADKQLDARYKALKEGKSAPPATDGLIKPSKTTLPYPAFAPMGPPMDSKPGMTMPPPGMPAQAAAPATGAFNMLSASAPMALLPATVTAGPTLQTSTQEPASPRLSSPAQSFLAQPAEAAYTNAVPFIRQAMPGPSVAVPVARAVYPSAPTASLTGGARPWPL